VTSPDYSRSNRIKAIWLAVTHGTGGAKPFFFEDLLLDAYGPPGNPRSESTGQGRADKRGEIPPGQLAESLGDFRYGR
jgi:hypothetical protein